MSNSTRVHRPSGRLNTTVLVAAALTLGAIGSGCDPTTPTSSVSETTVTTNIETTSTSLIEATSTSKYGEAVMYESGIGGQILTENDLIRIGISGATDTPTTRATLAVYFRDQSEFDTIQTVDLNVPVDIGGFSIELVAVNVEGRWVAVEIREPLETTK